MLRHRRLNHHHQYYRRRTDKAHNIDRHSIAFPKQFNNPFYSMCLSIFGKRSSRGNGRNSNRKPASSSSRPRASSSADDGFSTAEFNHPTSTTSASSNNHNKHSQSSTQSSHTSLSSLKSSLATNPKIYDLAQIRSATNNFLLKPAHSSSSSTAWHTTLTPNSNSNDVVVITQRKLRRPITASALRATLHRVCRSHHAALVRLHGAAVSGTQIYLVYEKVEGGSLSDCLRNPRNPSFTVLSNWLSRVQIATDLADALDYLHNSSGGFVHNHVKSSSIVVTEEPALGAKLCHYGTAQLCGEPVEEERVETDVDVDGGGGKGEEEEMTTTVRASPAVGSSSSSSISTNKAVKVEGTRGYMSPEYTTTGVATRKTDVYSFGVVLLELLTGEEPLKFVAGEGGTFRRVSLVESGREAMAARDGGGGLRKWVDWRLKDSYPVEVVERMAMLAVECCEDDPDKRPDMGRVAGFVSKQYLDSKCWAERFGLPTDFTVSFAPR